ncbi:hypothetical protein MPSEU_000295400 [Mayamaea pseudoterrestris]|nr:hypothetical protein MPSEU_000295400 [Mayamaea pseudoterrestris]
MSNARKLQTEIDRVMKKIDEGVELFDDIWEKVYSAEQQNQKEKYEVDLKKEIKKLQRHRDQIKAWISGSDVKDKDALMEARRLIETKMEQFKVCEKETKTKTYSKEGLAREDKLDPSEEAKLNTASWLQEYIEKLKRLVEDTDFEIERLSAGKGKKTNKSQIEKLKEHITNHRNHISKMEGIIRLINNDRLEVDTVDALKDDIDYYLESYEDEDYHSAYDEDYFYESLGLEELDVVNVDMITAAVTNSKKADGDDPSMSSKGSEDKRGKGKAAISSVIPLTIGRARVGAAPAVKVEEPKLTPVKKAPAAPVPVKSPVPASPAASQVQGASMAAILKRESEQQEKERQKAEQVRQQAAQRQQQEAQQRQQEIVRQQEALQAQQQQEAQKRQQEAVRQQQEAAAQLAVQQQAQQAAAAAEKAKNVQPPQPSGNNGLELLTSGLNGLGLSADSGANSVTTATATSSGGPSPNLDAGSLASALSESFATSPNMVDNDRSRQYTPQNPYPTPTSYPSTPAGIFENPAVFEKLGTDCLFFIFYYMQGTYQQYLAARELKKQSWRFHKKYMTWFQRHEEPKITTDEYEQGTYVYFDYETGWCTRIKSDFRFEYAYLEDSLQ